MRYLLASYRSAFAALFAVLGACGLVACGASSHDSGPSSASTTVAVATVGAPPPNIIASQQLASYPVSSPAHALLVFWQAVQFSDVLAARSLVSPEALASTTPGRFTMMVETVGDNIPGLQVVSSTKMGANASVRVFLVYYAANRTVFARSPQSFTLRAGQRGYQLSDLSYFLREAQTILADQHKR